MTWPFPNNLKSIILQWGRLFTSGRHSKQTAVLPGVDIPANSPQNQTVLRSERWQTTQELHRRLYRPQLTYEMIKFMTLQLWKYGISMAHSEGLPEKSISYLKKHGSTVLVCKVASKQTIRLLEQCPLNMVMRPRWRCLQHVWWKPNKYVCTNTSYQKSVAGGGLRIMGLFCSHRTWAPHSH